LARTDTICAFVDLHPEFRQLARLLNGVLEPKLTEDAKLRAVVEPLWRDALAVPHTR